MLSKIVSMDIVRYLQEDKNLSVEEISTSMNTTSDHIKKVIAHKELFTGEDLTEYLKSSKLHFWEFAIEAIPLSHLTEKAKDRIELCQKVSIHLKNKKL